jgi:ABC-2 type transport system permease protein
MTAAITLWHKHMRKFLANPEEMIGLMIQPVLWVVLFGVGMRGMVSGDVPTGEDSYVTFMLPGIVALSALGGAIGGGSAWLSERLRGIVKEYLVAPIPRLSILMGQALSTLTKSMIQAIAILAVGVVIGAELTSNPLGWLGGLTIVTGFGLGFSGLALMMASRTNNPGAYHAMIMVFNLPMLFLSNALYPLAAMPSWMRIGSLINPTTYTIDGLRQMLFRYPGSPVGSGMLPLWLCWVVVAAFAALGVWMATSAFRKSVR